MKNEDSMTAARPGRQKSEEKRTAILHAAGQSFLERGLLGASMDQIARDAGVSKQTVYSHFGSKEDLFQEVIRNKCRRYALLESELSTAGDVAEGLLTFARRYLELMVDPQVVAMTRQVIAQSTEHPEMAELYRRAGPSGAIDRLAEFLGQCRDSGRLEIADPEEAAADFVHETGARFKFEMLMNVRADVSAAERERHARRRVQQFVETYARG